jgi:SHAQKYF class myb-like DNA-binding protein
MNLFLSTDDSLDKAMDPSLDLPQDNSLDETQGVSSSENSNAGENTGRWTTEEHRLFLQGLEQHGKGWKKIASLIKSRTVVQIRTHAQKYFQKLAKSKQVGDESENVGVSGGSSANPNHGRHVGSLGTGRTLLGGDVGSSSFDGKRRKNQLSGTKRKAISSVVASAIRERKKHTDEDPSDPNTLKSHIAGVAPTLVPFVKLARISSSSSEDTSTTTLSSSILEESL